VAQAPAAAVHFHRAAAAATPTTTFPEGASMNTTFDEWLARLRRAKKLAPEIPPATRGRVWRQAVRLPGNWTGSTMRAQVRLYPDAPGDPLADVLATGPFVEGDTTVWSLQLAGGFAANSTGALPADSDGGGAVDLAFDVLLTP